MLSTASSTTSGWSSKGLAWSINDDSGGSGSSPAATGATSGSGLACRSAGTGGTTAPASSAVQRNSSQNGSQPFPDLRYQLPKKEHPVPRAAPVPRTSMLRRPGPAPQPTAAPRPVRTANPRRHRTRSGTSAAHPALRNTQLVGNHFEAGSTRGATGDLAHRFAIVGSNHRLTWRSTDGVAIRRLAGRSSGSSHLRCRQLPA